MKISKVMIVFLALFGVCAYGETKLQDNKLMKWSELPDLPSELGVAGPFVGVHNDALIIAGGANFPLPLWETSKIWHDDIYVLTKDVSSRGDSYKWITGLKLEKPIAYGAAVSTPHGVVCIGGNDSKHVYSDVFLLGWDPSEKNITQKQLPSLPSPCAYGSAVAIGDKIYVAGGTSNLAPESAMRNFWMLDFSNMDDSDNFLWQELLPWPGPSRGFNITVAQHDGKGNCIYVISGRRIGKDGNPQFLKDIYSFDPSLFNSKDYNPETGEYAGEASPWKKCKDIPVCVMAGTGIAVGQNHLFVLGGADGTYYGKEDLLKDDHPGFPKRSWAYHTITDTWVQAGEIPANHVTTIATRWGDDVINGPIVIASGEIRPRTRTVKIWKITLLKKEEKFGFFDFGILFFYLLSMIGVGVFFSFRNKSSDDFFRGAQRVPWIVAGLSIFATMLSSLTFIAIPAKAFATDWVFFMINMMAVAITPVIIIFFLPFFRKIDATSAYEYLEKRFNTVVKLFASTSFILFQIGRMAIVLYLPAIALSVITPMTEIQCIAIIGILSIIYCTMGGLKAVVWTDSIQSVVLLGGALVSLVLIIAGLKGGFGEFFSTAFACGKFHMINWDFSSTSFVTSALWVIVLGGLAQNLIPYSSDMAVVQRYMSVPTERQAKSAIWTNAIAVIPASIIFFGVGTALFVFYKANPDKLDPTFKTDAIFPLFIARELPLGIAGLIVAGIFAASQSTISTSINSISTAFVTDFIRPLNRIKTEKGYLRLARLVTFASGCLGTILALLFAISNIRSSWDLFMTLLGLIAGSMCGLFLLGIFTKRTNGVGAIIGAVAGVAATCYIKTYAEIHFLLYAVVGIVTCCLVGYLASLFGKGVSKDIDGLTIWTSASKVFFGKKIS